jgi:creatinine amidohydrolase
MISYKNTAKEIKESKTDTAVIAFGSIEQHSDHLPVATDYLIAQDVAELLAEELDAYLVPAMPFGCSREHMAYRGTITLRPFTLAAVMEDIVESLRTHGFKKIVVVNTHEANWIIKPTLRELSYKYPDLIIVWANGMMAERNDPIPADIHAGEWETAIMMHNHPDLVKPDQIGEDSPGYLGQEFLDYVGLDKTTKAGAWGSPGAATVEKGEQIMKGRIQKSLEYIRYAIKKVSELKQL